MLFRTNRAGSGRIAESVRAGSLCVCPQNLSGISDGDGDSDQQEEGFEAVLEHTEKYLHNPHWEEVLLLLIAQQKRKNPAKILKAILEHDTPYEQWLHRNVLFAGSVLAENVPVTDTDLVRSIIGQLMVLEVTRSPLATQELRDRIFRIIGGLYETAFEPTALEQLEIHRDKLECWRLLRIKVS